MNKLIAAIEALPKGLGVFLSENGSYTQFSDLTTDDLKALVAELEKYQTPCTGICGYQAPYGFVPEADCPIHDKAN